MKRVLMTGTVLLGIAAAMPASALPITGTTTLTSTGTAAVVTVQNLLNTFSLNLAVGGSITVNALSLTPVTGNGTATYDFTVADTIAFTLPSSGTDLDLGTGSFHVQGNSINSGGFTWADGANGTNVALSGGYVVNVNLSDITNAMFNEDHTNGTSPEIVTATFTFVSGPTGGGGAAVPEPFSLTLMVVGLLGVGLVKRRRA
jgi:hypothetical protein